MKKLPPIYDRILRFGELYLFHPTNSRCPAEDSLWGLYDKTEDGVIYLEHSTFDLCRFWLKYKLPAHYEFCRLATRDELRDYMYSLGYHDGTNSLSAE